MYKLLSTLNKCWQHIIILLHFINVEKLKGISKKIIFDNYIYDQLVFEDINVLIFKK